MRPPEAVPLAAKPANPAAGDTRAGFFYALSAYVLWGFLPLYMKLLAHIPAWEVVVHRVIWSVPVALIILIALRRTGDILPTIRNPKRLSVLFICALVISLNWGLYVWAISVDRAVETALGYYINPLISVAMGAVILGEKLQRLQMMAVGLAVVAVLFLTFAAGTFPWLSLVLALSFATYGFLRKTVDVGPTQGFLVEVLLISILAIPFWLWLLANGQNNFGGSISNVLLFVGCGPITAIPLILYAFGAKGLRLSTIGMMQYIAPTMIFLIGVFVFGEPFGWQRAIAFAIIWLALALYSWSVMQNRKNAPIT